MQKRGSKGPSSFLFIWFQNQWWSDDAVASSSARNHHLLMLCCCWMQHLHLMLTSAFWAADAICSSICLLQLIDTLGHSWTLLDHNKAYEDITNLAVPQVHEEPWTLLDTLRPFNVTLRHTNVNGSTSAWGTMDTLRHSRCHLRHTKANGSTRAMEPIVYLYIPLYTSLYLYIHPFI